MRPLAKYQKKELIFKGTVKKFSIEIKEPKKETALIININCETSEEEIKFQHIWLYLSDELNQKKFRIGDIITFNATVWPYLKRKNEIDYGLINICKVKKIGFDKRHLPIIKMEESKRIGKIII
jgi:hypothetical protein